MSDNKSSKNEPVTTDTIPAKIEAKKRYALSGSTSEEFNHILANQVVNTVWYVQNDKDGAAMQQLAAVALMRGMQPNDEIEGMIIAQMIAMHNASMECLRRAMISEQTFAGRGQNLNCATKLSRSYAALLDSLNRYRGKGVSEQKVTVQHVHVSEGGQAIVGNVGR